MVLFISFDSMWIKIFLFQIYRVAPLVHPANWANKFLHNFWLKWNQNLRILLVEAYPNMYKKHTRKSGFGNWTTEIGPIENMLIDKNYKGHGKSCPRMEDHAYGTGNVPCHLHDFPFLGMICCGLYNFCLLACFLWGLFRSSNFQIWIFLSIFNVIIDALLMIVLSCFNSILVKT
jgi:hypothetical protein